jgi:hypothetical protein
VGGRDSISDPGLSVSRELGLGDETSNEGVSGEESVKVHVGVAIIINHTVGVGVASDSSYCIAIVHCMPFRQRHCT